MIPSILDDYDPQGFYCEMLRGAASEVVRERVSSLSIDALQERAAAANAELYNLGIMPGAGGTQNLPRAVGERRAKEIILTGRPFTAAEAYEWGMVNRLCAPGRVVDEALETGRCIADNGPISIRQAKHAIHYGMQMDLASGMMLEIEAYNRMVPTEDRREGVAAFNEKRKPRFSGR